MDLGLKNKVAIITGAHKAIGLAIASMLAEEGCLLSIAGSNENELQAAERFLEENSYPFISNTCNLTNSSDVNKLVQATIKAYGNIHILVNNYGDRLQPAKQPFTDIIDDDWLKIVDINLLANIRMIRQIIPIMQAQGWGRIINVSNISSIMPTKQMDYNNATKAALNNLSKSLANTYGQDGILINVVTPGHIEFPKEAIKSKSPIVDRSGTPKEVAAAVTFLASEQASFITGCNLRVDGGSIPVI